MEAAWIKPSPSMFTSGSSIWYLIYIPIGRTPWSLRSLCKGGGEHPEEGGGGEGRRGGALGAGVQMNTTRDIT